MRILAIVSGAYGERHVDNIRQHGPETWELNTWKAPPFFPPVIDDPEDFLPPSLPEANLILSFAEHKGAAELLPDIAKMTGAQAVIVGVDNDTWLPRGLAGQLRGWLETIGVAFAAPKPLCSLTETQYGVTLREHQEHNSPLIAEFAKYFGKPELELSIDEQARKVTAVEVKRDAVCGCAHFTAEGLVGITIDEAEEKAGLLHHHYPCMASMGIDSDFNDTLMHISGNIMKESVTRQLKPYKRYITPGDRSE